MTMLNNALGRDGQTEKITGPKKYDGDKEALHPFLTGMDLYFFKKAPRYAIDVSKVARVYEFLKGRVAVWMQPLMEDYLTNKGAHEDLNECKKETRELFSSWDDFKDKMTVIFGEIN